jgi:antibiotic biosynthesis monooxygenase (ABM) superfamily enzyme
MELLYPVGSHAPAGSTPAGESVTVLIDRTVPSSQQESFLASLKGLREEFARFPGTSGSMIFRRKAGGDVEFSILQRFESGAAHDAWLASPGFARWRQEVTPAGQAPGHVHRYSGMESFFVSAQAPAAPPRWKMAALLLVAVYPMSLAMSRWLAPALAHLPLFTGALLTSVPMVLAMTYVLVPLLTKVFERWLQPAGSGSDG